MPWNRQINKVKAIIHISDNFKMIVNYSFYCYFVCRLWKTFLQSKGVENLLFSPQISQIQLKNGILDKKCGKFCWKCWKLRIFTMKAKQENICIICLKLEILLGKAADSGRLARNPFQRVIFKTAARGVKLSDARLDAENTLAVGGNHTVWAELARRRNIFTVQKAFSHFYPSFQMNLSVSNRWWLHFD